MSNYRDFAPGLKKIQEFTSTGTWTQPHSGVTVVHVLLVAGGGGGEGNAADPSGGGGGQIVERDVKVSGNVTVTIGAGGSGGTEGGSEAGSDGSNSTFAGDTTLTALAGGGGAAQNVLFGIGGGYNPAPTGTVGVPTSNATGVANGSGSSLGAMGGMGLEGNDAGPSAGAGYGGVEDNPAGGGGGSFGNGGAGQTAANGDSAAANSGGGGGGTTSAGLVGGTGGSGFCRVTWFE